MDRWMTEQTTLGREPSQRINVEIIQPPVRVADRLALSPDDRVVVRRRVRYLNNEPFDINDTFYSFELVQGPEVVNPAGMTRGAS